MAKGAYIGVSGVARKIKKGYIGVGGVARKIKKAYIGVGGVARPFWSGGGTPVEYGEITPLYESKGYMGSGTFGDKAVFVAGYNQDNKDPKKELNSIDVYDNSLTHTNPTTHTDRAYRTATTAVGNYFFVAGGYNSYYDQAFNYVYAYDSAFTRVMSSGNLDLSHTETHGASVGNYAIFTTSYQRGYFSVYSTSLTKTNSISWDNKNNHRYNFASGNVGNYALFAGGYYGDDPPIYYDEVICLNGSLTKSRATQLSIARSVLSSASTKGHAFFGGGDYYENYNTVWKKNVDVYNASLTRSLTYTVHQVQDDLEACALEEHTFFATKEGIDNTTYIEVFDSSLSVVNTFTLPLYKLRVSAASTKNYAIFAGGFGSYQLPSGSLSSGWLSSAYAFTVV